MFEILRNRLLENVPEDFIAQEEQKFAALLNEIPMAEGIAAGKIVEGKIVEIDKEAVIVEVVGLKAQGRIPIREFSYGTQPEKINNGDIVEVYVEKLEDNYGYMVMSREKARKEKVWLQIEESFKKADHVKGVILNSINGGYSVDLFGALAFLPSSHVDVRKIGSIDPIVGVEQPFKILKMDRARGNIVVSRRAILEESRERDRQVILAKLEEGQVVEGIVKNLTDYGAFVDLGGGVDGLLHVTDIAWKRVEHPSDALKIGQQIKAQIIRIYNERGIQRVSLGIKQLEGDPWANVESKYQKKTVLSGKVTNITDYGVFVELEPGVEGLVHSSEMSWTKKNLNPKRMVSPQQEVKVIILDVDNQKRRISLSIKKAQENPWTTLQQTLQPGDVIDVVVKNHTEFGLFVGINEEIDGMVHLSDVSWEGATKDKLAEFKNGEKIKVKVLDISAQEERVSLGIKQLASDPFDDVTKGLNKGDVVTCTITKVLESAIEVVLGENSAPGIIKKSDLARDKVGQKPELFASGEKVDAKIVQIDKPNRKVFLSVKALEIEEMKQVMKEYGSYDSGASLGDILGFDSSKNQGSGKGGKNSNKSE